jgi:uncharacterized membrane protein
MARRREERENKKKGGNLEEIDLDEGYLSPIHSPGDLTVSSIRSVLLSSRYIQLLLSLTLIGAVLRLFNLGFNSLWLDEASTLTFAKMSIGQIWQVSSTEFNPPLFYWLENFMLSFGSSEAVLRLLPAIFGILTIPVMYYVGKEFLDRNTGIIAAAACAFSPFLVYYSQEARAYSMMLFFVACAMVFYLRAMREWDIRNWALFGLFSAIAFWSHYYAVVIIASLVIYALAIQLKDGRRNLPRLKAISAGLAVAVIVCLPLIIYLGQLFLRRTGSGALFGVQGMQVILQTFFEVSGYNFLVMFILCALFVLGIVHLFTRDREKGLFLVYLTAMSFIISILLSYKMPMMPRYLIFFAMVFILGIAVSYRLFTGFPRSRQLVYVFILLLLAISFPALATHSTQYSHEDWRGFSVLMQQTTKPGDTIVMVPGYIIQPFGYYYDNTTQGTIVITGETPSMFEEAIAAKGNGSVYYVVTGDIGSVSTGSEAIGWIRSHTREMPSTSGIYLLAPA